jgi:hypothetical protein
VVNKGYMCAKVLPGLEAYSQRSSMLVCPMKEEHKTGHNDSAMQRGATVSGRFARRDRPFNHVESFGKLSLNWNLSQVRDTHILTRARTLAAANDDEHTEVRPHIQV